MNFASATTLGPFVQGEDKQAAYYIFLFILRSRLSSLHFPLASVNQSQNGGKKRYDYIKFSEILSIIK